MICVAVTYLIEPGHEEEAIELFATLTERTHTEPGNLFYLVHRSTSLKSGKLRSMFHSHNYDWSLFRSQPDLLGKSSRTSLIAAGDDSLFDSFPGENGRLPTNASEQSYWPG
jgi:Antibiotic biosynthesis monooxygenase